MNRIKVFLSMLLALSLCLMPFCASAESDAELPPVSMMTLTLDNLTINDSTLPLGTLPVDLSITIGSDGLSLDTLRALIELDFGFDGEDLAYLAAAIEDNEVKLHISGVSQDISIPMNQALEALLSEAFLYGKPLSEAPPEFMEAFGDLLSEVNALAAGEYLTQTSETPSHYLYSEDDWRTFFVEYPARMRALSAGEEEITFNGKTYTARKYTYDTSRLNSEEYDEYRNGLVITNEEYRVSTAATAGFEDALNRMYEIGHDMLLEDALDSGADVEQNISPEDETFFSEKGTFYLIDEVMGTLETGTRTAHYSDGTEYTEQVEYMAYMTDTELVEEHLYTTPTGSTREANSVTVGEDGTFTVVTSVQSADTVDYSDLLGIIMSYSADVTSTEVISDTAITASQVETITYTYSYPDDGTVETEKQSTNMQMSGSMVSDTLADFSLSVSSTADYDGEASTTDMAMDFTAEVGMLPEGTLLRVSGKPFNPLDASEEELTAYGDELYMWLMNIVNSVIPAIETPSSVGGALLE